MKNDLKAIVVDDRANVVDILSDVLKENNVDVIGQGRNGKDAVELYGKLKPDIVFLDVLMPIYDGFYGLKEIRKINPSALIVFVSGDPMLETKMYDESVIPSAILHKPFDINKVSNIISTLKLTLSYSKVKMDKNLVKLSLERTLFEMDPKDLKNIKSKLQSDYGMDLDNSIEHPENLKIILHEFYPNNYELLMGKIENSLSGFTSHPRITKFLKILYL